MKPVIKWPGGKAGEIKHISNVIPDHKRYIEPFFGGGALFFHLNPQIAAINDISSSLIEYYKLLKRQDTFFQELLLGYNCSFVELIRVSNMHYDAFYDLFRLYYKSEIDEKELYSKVKCQFMFLSKEIHSVFYDGLIIDREEFNDHLINSIVDKIKRTSKNHSKREFSPTDLKENIITGLTSGFYLYFRKVYNDLSLKKIVSPSIQYQVANFYFIREYCYGSMFRYNKSGEFNIPYGGMSYNNKNFTNKIDAMFNQDMKNIFANTEICNLDFEEFLNKSQLNSNDFMFLDPPYDTNFSSYEGKDFTLDDQARLAYCLKKTTANIILIIKNTDYIYNLYKDDFNISAFDNTYTYNVRSRNERSVKHLIITK